MGLNVSNTTGAEIENFYGDQPASWQADKALYERYGGRVVHLNLSGWEPVEAYVRLFYDMEDHQELEFYDPQVRADVLERLGRFMQSAVEVDDGFRQREGMQQPWERPWWHLPTSEEIQNKLKATQSTNQNGNGH